MLGQAIYRVQRPIVRWIWRWWGVPDINTRQKWAAMFPYLRRLGERARILDAGCGRGLWALELAARFPSWRLVGIDKDEGAIDQAERLRRKLGLRNVFFEVADFLEYAPDELFDAVLSVASAHYLVQEGRGEELFAQFRRWMRPGGRLLLLGPRCRKEVPTVSWLPKLSSLQRDIFRREDLEELCAGAGLAVESLHPACFHMATIAKQISLLHGRSRALTPALYPAEAILTAADGLFALDVWGSQQSAFWLLLARAQR